MVKKPKRLSAWPEPQRGGFDRERIRHPGASIGGFIRADFTREEAESLVRDGHLRPTSRLGKKYCRRRREEVAYYMKELQMTKDEAIERASTLRDELTLYVDSPTGAFADALKWSTKYTSQRIIWGKSESLDDVAKRFDASYINPRRPVEEWY